MAAAVYIASVGSYGLNGALGSAFTAYWAKVAGRNCIGPSAPVKFAPEWTPGAVDWPWSLSTSPIPASTPHGRLGHTFVAPMYRARYAGGICDMARTLGPPAMPVPAKLAAGPVMTSSTNVSGSTTDVAAATASHLNTGLLPRSGSGRIHRAPAVAGTQPMQMA